MLARYRILPFRQAFEHPYRIAQATGKMNIFKICHRCLLVIPQITLVFINASADVVLDRIRFDDIKPAGVELEYSYEAIGIDPNDNVYALLCGDAFPANCALFQYNHRTGQKRLIGTLIEAAKRSGNFAPNRHWKGSEEMTKGHAHLPYLNGKIYIGSQGFHGLGGDKFKQRFSIRGAHLFAYDPDTDRLTDISTTQPEGVFLPNEGFIALGAMPSRNLIVGLGNPLGTLVIYNVNTGQAQTELGDARYWGQHVGRELIISPYGKIYTSWGWNSNVVMEYDLDTGKSRDTGIRTREGFWHGHAYTRDRQSAYLSTFGNLYKFDFKTGKFDWLTYMLPESEVRSGALIRELWGITLSLDEKKLYWLPHRIDNGDDFSLYEYDIASRQITKLSNYKGRLTYGAISGSNICDSSGNIYFIYFSWASPGASLLKIKVGT